MSTMAATATLTETPDAPKAPKAPKSYSIRLLGQGAKEVQIIAYRTKAGFQLSATKYTAKAVKGTKRAGERGASSTYATLEEAVKAAEKLSAAFIKAGWKRPERKGPGFVRKADAFDAAHLPKP